MFPGVGVSGSLHRDGKLLTMLTFLLTVTTQSDHIRPDDLKKALQSGLSAHTTNPQVEIEVFGPDVVPSGLPSVQNLAKYFLRARGVSVFLGATIATAAGQGDVIEAIPTNQPLMELIQRAWFGIVARLTTARRMLNGELSIGECDQITGTAADEARQDTLQFRHAVQQITGGEPQRSAPKTQTRKPKVASGRPSTRKASE